MENENVLRVGIFGTDHDQPNIKKIVNNTIDDNIKITNFIDFESFGIEPGLHPHQQCISAVSNIDIAIFFINKNYGEPYKGDKFWKERPDDWIFDIAVTHAEYRQAQIRKIPTIVFVDSKADDDLFNSFVKGKEELSSDNDRYEMTLGEWSKVAHYIENIKLCCFIREVKRGIEENQLYPTWAITKYEYNESDRDDSYLKNLVCKAITGLTPWIIRDLSSRQAIALNDELQLKEINYKFIKKKKLFIDRKLQSIEGVIFRRPKNTINKAPNHIMIIGPGHVGKTLFMIDLFCDHVKRSNRKFDRDIPIFFSFRNRNTNIVDLSSIIEYEINSHRSNVPKKLLDLSNVNITLYIDGIDKGSYIDTNNFKIFFNNLKSLKHLKLVISLRQEYYDLNFTTFEEIFRGTIRVYKILEMEKDEGKILIYNAFKALHPSTDFSHLDLDQYFPSNIFYKPMYCMMAAYVLPQNRDRELDFVTIGDEFIKLIAQHETKYLSDKGRSDGGKSVDDNVTYESLLKMWIDIACIVSWKKNKGEEVFCENIKNELDSKGFNINHWNRTEGSLIECKNGIIEFKVDIYLDILLSEKIVNDLLYNGNNEKLGFDNKLEFDDKLLAIDTYYDTKVILNYRFQSLSLKQLQKIQKKLFYIAFENICGDQENIRIASNCIYLLGQIGNVKLDKKKAKRILRALRELTITGSFAHVGSLYALTELGDQDSTIDINKQHIEPTILKRDVDFHLIYYRAFRPQNLFPPNIPVSEGAIDCSRLFDGLASNIKKKKGHERLKIYCELIYYSLLAYQCRDSKDKALYWINKFEQILIDINSDESSNLIEHCRLLFENARKKIELDDLNNVSLPDITSSLSGN